MEDNNRRIDLTESGRRDGELTTLQKMFADFYLDSRDVTRSYIKAYYDAQNREWTKEDLPSIRACAYRLRKNKRVKKYIDQVIQDRRESDALKPDELVLRLTELINNPASDANTVLKATDMLAKYYGMYTQDLDSNKSNVVINLSNNSKDGVK